MCKNSEKAVRLSAVVRSRSRWPAWRGVVLVGVVMLLSACRVDLYTKVPENDANEMLAALLRSSVDAEKVAEKKSDSFTIRVEESQIPAAIAILKDHGFPRENFATFGELFKKEGLISSPLEERVRFIYALSQNVQETLSRIDGVVTARVHIVLPENNPFSDDVKPSSASVFIKYLPETRLDEIKSEIKMIVARSIEGLSYDQVSLVMLAAAVDKGAVDQVRWSTLLGFRMPVESAQPLRTMVLSLTAATLVLLIAVVYLGLWIRRVKRAGTVESLKTPVLPERVGDGLRKTMHRVSGA